MKVPELSKNKAFALARIDSPKTRRESGLFCAEGKKCVFDTYSGFSLHYLIVEVNRLSSILQDSMASKYIHDAMRQNKLYTASSSLMRKLSRLSTTSDVIAFYHLPDMECDGKIILQPDNLYLALDGIQDPGNMGTVIRSAHWFGIKEIFASVNCVDIFNRKCVQSTMGSLSAVKVRYTNLETLIYDNGNIPVAGLLLDGKNIYMENLPKGALIVMGNEGRGISAGIRNLITDPLTIPPFDSGNHSESLNVAVATSVTLALFRRPSV